MPFHLTTIYLTQLKIYFANIFSQIIKVKRKALEDEESTDNNNLSLQHDDDELYRETIQQFPELRSMPKEDIVNQIKLSMTSKKVSEGVGKDENIPTRKIFIDHVLCNDTKFNDAEVRDHVYTVVAAGSETTALQTAHTSKP